MVWEARQLSPDRRVAVKVYQRELHEADQRHFVREASAAAKLSAHPGIVTSYGAGILPDDRPYLVMELCPGGSLTKWLKSANRPSEEQVRQVGLHIAQALAAAHAVGVLHRDVKPANILIDGRGHPRLADFGLAIELDAASDAGDNRWLTPAWAPPEAFRMQPATAAGDVFSLAATLYALLAGRPPRAFDAASTLDQMAEVAEKPIPPIPGVSRTFMDILFAALAGDPAARPSAMEFLNQLRDLPARTAVGPAVVGGAGGGESQLRRKKPSGEERPAVSQGHQVAAVPVRRETQPTAAAGVAPVDAPRERGSRRRVILALAAALVIMVASASAWLMREPTSSGVPAPVTRSTVPGGQPSSTAPSEPSASRPPTSTEGADKTNGPAPRKARSIRLVDSLDPVEPFQTAEIKGTYVGGANTLLQVQRREKGTWAAFPVPTKTDPAGRFTARVQIGRPGRYRLRVVDVKSGVKSEPVELVVKR